LKQQGAKQVSLLATLTHANLKYLNDFLALANDLETGISFSMFVGVGAGALPGTEDLALTAGDLSLVGRQIMQNNLPIDMDILTRDHEERSAPQEVHLPAKDSCGAGSRILSVDYDGGVYPCHMLMKPSLRMGTLPGDNLQDILTKTPLGKFFRGVTVDGIDTCQKCDLRYFCGGGCRASAYAVNKDLLAHDPACSLYRTAIHDMLTPLF
jgi:radical SAM protein with 4Fe4S-binding SPASM domain